MLCGIFHYRNKWLLRRPVDQLWWLPAAWRTVSVPGPSSSSIWRDKTIADEHYARSRAETKCATFGTRGISQSSAGARRWSARLAHEIFVVESRGWDRSRPWYVPGARKAAQSRQCARQASALHTTSVNIRILPNFSTLYIHYLNTTPYSQYFLISNKKTLENIITTNELHRFAIGCYSYIHFFRK